MLSDQLEACFNAKMVLNRLDYGINNLVFTKIAYIIYIMHIEQYSQEWKFHVSFLVCRGISSNIRPRAYIEFSFLLLLPMLHIWLSNEFGDILTLFPHNIHKPW